MHASRSSLKIPQLDGPIPDPYDDVLSTPNVNICAFVIFLRHKRCNQMHSLCFPLFANIYALIKVLACVPGHTSSIVLPILFAIFLAPQSTRQPVLVLPVQDPIFFNTFIF